MADIVRVVLADDHPIYRQGLKQIIAADRRLAIVGEAGDGRAALEQIQALKPDVAVLDIDMPDLDGFDLARAIRDRRLATRVVFLTLHKDERFLNAALDTGVAGYVVKDGAVTEIVECITAVASGRHWVSPALSTHLVHRSRRAEDRAASVPGLAALTPVERRILGLLAEFKTTREIADLLCVSPRTVDHHRANMAEKLMLRGPHALTRFAVEHHQHPKKSD
jgi:DNA-binding NarL/FixJ family response regulator